MDGSTFISVDVKDEAGAGSAPDDARLLARFAAGDRSAASLLTTRLAPRILQMAVRVLNDRAEAEDITQEAMLRLWRIAPDWQDGHAKVGTWLYQVALNLCRDRLRRRKGRNVALEDVAEPSDETPSVAAQMQAATRLAALETALAALPDRQRQAVVLRHLQELSNPEIAEIMGISVEAVESLTARGKRALAAQLSGRRADLGYDDEA